MRSGFTRRMAVASALLAVVVGAAFGILAAAVSDLRDSGRVAQQSFAELAAANRLEKLLVDLETGVRGYLLTGEERFLEPYRQARTIFPRRARALVALADDPRQRALARQISTAGGAYIGDYAGPLIAAARRGERAARGVGVIADGKQRVDALRDLFARYETTEAELADAHRDRSDGDAHRATVAALAGLGGSVLLILFFGWYLLRAIMLPVQRAALMAGRLAGGELSVRMPESGSAEIGELERAFNTMGRSLEVSRDELRQVAEEQAALRRVAILVARRVPPAEVFAAVAVEVRALLGAASARLWRYEDGETAVLVADDSEPPAALPIGTVMRPQAVDEADAGQTGLRAAVSRTVAVEDRRWGALTVGWVEPGVPEGAEARLGEFGDLVGTAIANAESRAQLAASRARVVAASDETRRRIERDLHDGAQQRLVALALGLRALEARIPPDLAELRRQVADAGSGLAAVTDELREMSRGIHPAILSEGGLRPALKALARRSAVPVDLQLSVTEPVPEGLITAVYYIVSEALTNAARHAEASGVTVSVGTTDGVLRLSVSDDGRGGADERRGSGLIGLTDRVEALGGTMSVVSPPGAGTSLSAEIPLPEAG